LLVKKWCFVHWLCTYSCLRAIPYSLSSPRRRWPFYFIHAK